MKLSERVEVVLGNITALKVDAIVNAANSSLLGGGGVDGAIHRAGGIEILNECRLIIASHGECKVGDAIVTTAGNLQAKIVIHTVGPRYNGANYGRLNFLSFCYKNSFFRSLLFFNSTIRAANLLSSCYKNSLIIADANNCKTIAFPSISTGVYGFPKYLAAIVAVKTSLEYLKKLSNIEKVIFVCYDEDNYRLIEEQVKLQISL